MSEPNPERQTLTPEQAESERAADEREAEVIQRFFAHILGGTLKPSCSRLGSSQQIARRKKKYRGPK